MATGYVGGLGTPLVSTVFSVTGPLPDSMNLFQNLERTVQVQIAVICLILVKQL